MPGTPPTKKPSAALEWIRPHSLPLFFGVLCILVVVAVDIALPKAFGDYLVDGVLITRTNYSLLTWIALGGILLYLVKGVFRYGQVYLMSYVGQRVVCDLRARMYRHLLDMPLRQHARHKSGTLVSRMTSDVGVIQNAVTAGVADLIQHSLTLVAIIAMLFFLNWRLALVASVTLPLVTLAIRGYGSRVRSFTSRLQERIAALTATLQESLEGIRVVKAFLMEHERRRRFEEDNDHSFGASMKSVQAMATVTPVVELILVAGMMVVIWYGGHAVLAEEMTPGGLVSFLAYLGMATRPVGFLTKSFNLMQQAGSAAERISEVLEIPIEKGAASSGLKGKAQPQRLVGRVAFEHVDFAYTEGVPVLRDVTFSVEAGQTVALVGRSGAGKSTLVNLIPRFYRVQSGKITIDGYDVAELDLATLRRHIGLVPQETLLFGMTVLDNIVAGREGIDRQRVEEAAVMANAHEFISSLPDGYDTVVGERGATLSGGQRQRIAIARAVAGNPRILILDEATSALDAESEATVRDALIRVQKDRTTFVIAHRLSTVRGANKIVVLDEGRVAEMGTHGELLVTGSLYPYLYRTQFGGDAHTDEPALTGVGEA